MEIMMQISKNMNRDTNKIRYYPSICLQGYSKAEISIASAPLEIDERTTETSRAVRISF
jgi:hypothetical protein